MAPAYVESLGRCSGVDPLRPEKTLGDCPDVPLIQGMRVGGVPSSGRSGAVGVARWRDNFRRSGDS